MKVRPYVSIDIETTGIDDRSEILQIAAVLDDGISAIEDLPKMDVTIKHEVLEYSEPYALGMNADLFKRCMSKDFKTETPAEAIFQLIGILHRAQKEAGPDSKGKLQRVMLSGKNISTFDIPKLRIFIQKYDDNSKTSIAEFDKLIHYKTLDVGSLYFDVFGDNVSLSKINKLTGRPEVSHNALEDALDVVYAVRHKLNTTQKIL